MLKKFKNFLVRGPRPRPGGDLQLSSAGTEKENSYLVVVSNYPAEYPVPAWPLALTIRLQPDSKIDYPVHHYCLLYDNRASSPQSNSMCPSNVIFELVVCNFQLLLVFRATSHEYNNCKLSAV